MKNKNYGFVKIKMKMPAILLLLNFNEISIVLINKKSIFLNKQSNARIIDSSRNRLVSLLQWEFLKVVQIHFHKSPYLHIII